MTTTQYYRRVLALDDTELEQFVREWVDEKKSEYIEVTRFSGAGDLGRDVVGFLSAELHEGPWHNFQCKQYSGKLPTAIVHHEIGKILYYAHQGNFLPPTRYYFVAPKGVNRNIEKLLFNPEQFKKVFISEWDNNCASSIIDGTLIPLSGPLRAFVEAFDFSTIKRVSLDEILADANAKPILFKWFGADPGPAPVGKTPAEIQDSELPYINQLIDAYGEREGKAFSGHKEIVGHPSYGNHLSRQRERFYDAAAFKRFYRDNTDKIVLDSFENDIFHGVIETCQASRLSN